MEADSQDHKDPPDHKANLQNNLVHSEKHFVAFRITSKSLVSSASII